MEVAPPFGGTFLEQLPDPALRMDERQHASAEESEVGLEFPAMNDAARDVLPCAPPEFAGKGRQIRLEAIVDREAGREEETPRNASSSG